MRTVIMCIVFRKESDTEFLLLKRVPDKGAFWQPVGGAVEEYDETVLDAGYREMMEEAGIRKKDVLNVLKDVHQFEFDKHYLTGEPIPKEKVHVYAFEVRPEVEIHIHSNQDEEHEDFGWFSYDEAMEKLYWPNNKDAFEKLRGIL
ncbi:TPA: NUDIX domain-containing protein [Candidatus Woesearchaeota archaeon]|nr:NUDIX domain-containing protein [Candidatus Woesearchaeota archaeon]